MNCIAFAHALHGNCGMWKYEEGSITSVVNGAFCCSFWLCLWSNCCWCMNTVFCGIIWRTFVLRVVGLCLPTRRLVTLWQLGLELSKSERLEKNNQSAWNMWLLALICKLAARREVSKLPFKNYFVCILSRVAAGPGHLEMVRVAHVLLAVRTFSVIFGRKRIMLAHLTLGCLPTGTSPSSHRYWPIKTKFLNTPWLYSPNWPNTAQPENLQSTTADYRLYRLSSGHSIDRVHYKA
jgi:hypothetical protein